MDEPCRVYIDFRKYGLLLNTHIIVTPPIKALVRDSLKVSSPGKRQLINLSRNSYMIFLRSVTLQPIGMPSRSLKLETDFFALVLTAFCPVISPIFSITVSRYLVSFTDSLAPSLIPILCILRAALTLLYPNSF